MTDLIDAPANGPGSPPVPHAPVDASPLPRLEAASLPLLEHLPSAGSVVPAPTSPVPQLPPPTMATLAPPAAPVAASTPAAPATPFPQTGAAPAAPAAVAALSAPVPTEPAPPEIGEQEAAQPATGLVTGPSSILSPDPSMMPLEQSMPALPAPTVTPPPNTAADALGANGKGPLDIGLFDMPTAAAKKQTGGARRALGRLLLLCILGAGAYFGVQHGPDLYDQYVAQGDAVDEPEAPLSFPAQTAEPPPVRYAEFTLTGLTGAPEATYDVTTDFETNVTSVGITRPTGPDLEVLTFGDAAFIRRVDARQWYEIDRGNFPLQDRLERSDWVRHLDELIPVDQRRTVTIERSTSSTIASVPTRRLLLSLDAAMLGSASIPPVQMNDEVVADAPDVSDGVTGLVPEAVPADTDALADPGVAPAPAAEVEIWVDANGIVRQISGAPQLGAETITVVATSADAWVPEYPTADQVVPLTASALIELGI